MNEYKAYKNLVKHKKRINHVFSELSAATCFRFRRPGVDKKAQVVAVVSCSAAPPKAPRRRPSKKGRTALMTLLLLRFILARRSLLNQASENARHLKVLLMSRFRQLRALLI
jgi:hypothetical protein